MKNTTLVGIINDNGRILKMDKIVIDRNNFRVKDYVPWNEFPYVKSIFFNPENHEKFGINYDLDEENYDSWEKIYESKKNYINKIKEDGGIVIPLTCDYYNGISITNEAEACGYICFKKENFWRIGKGKEENVVQHLNKYIEAVNTIYVKENLYYFTYVVNGEIKCIRIIINVFDTEEEFWDNVKSSLPWIDELIGNLRNNLNIPLSFYKFYVKLENFCFCPDLLPENVMHLSYYDVQSKKFVVKLGTNGILNCEIIYDKNEIFVNFHNSKQSVLMKKMKSGKIKTNIFNGCGKETNNFMVSQDKDIFLKDHINEDFNIKFLNTIFK